MRCVVLVLAVAVTGCGPPAVEAEARAGVELPALERPALEMPAPESPALDLPRYAEGDVVFQTSRSSQSKAIQAATGSPMSHMGILYESEDGWHVFEASATVRLTPLGEWAARGDGGRIVIKRLDQGLSAKALAAMKLLGQEWSGRRYDLTFEWSDERLYCSELVYKLYERGADIQLGRLQEFREFELDHPAVRAPLRKRFGNELPLEEPVISPRAIYDDPRLNTVFDGVL